jgi:hypothetical protein
MRIIPFAAVVVVLPLAACHMFSSKKGPAEVPMTTAKTAPIPGLDFGVLPDDYPLRTVEAFQAKWPADVVYRYRFESPRRVQNSYSGRYGYAVRFRAQKVSVNAPMPEGFPWIAYFENGKVVWVQRDTEVGNGLKWFDSEQAAFDWPRAN